MNFINNSAAKDSIGLRNNNPGNIRYNSNINWQGQLGNANSYVQFSDITYGIRAMALNLYNQYYKYGLKTLIAMISKYAPKSDGNNPVAYAAYVSDQTGIPVDADMQIDANIIPIVIAMIKQEIGPSYAAMISNEDIQNGIAMVGKFELSTIKATGFVRQNWMPIVIIAASGTALAIYLHYAIKNAN